MCIRDRRYNVRPRENLIIAFNVGEEGLGNLCGVRPVSYTHLDVYKRQLLYRSADVQVNAFLPLRDNLQGMKEIARNGRQTAAVGARWTVARDVYKRQDVPPHNRAVRLLHPSTAQ